MLMGPTGMAMPDVEMPMPDNTLMMMTGSGQFGPIEMGGMFTVMKIREGLASNDYRDPGPYRHPPGTVAYEFKGETAQVPAQGNAPAPRTPQPPMTKPGMGGMKHP